MEDLGDLSGLDYNTAYFMKYGVNAPYKRNDCRLAPPEFDWERLHEPDAFYCWRGCRLPQWM
jgi:hypothetical protein